MSHGILSDAQAQAIFILKNAGARAEALFAREGKKIKVLEDEAGAIHVWQADQRIYNSERHANHEEFARVYGLLN